MPCKQRSDNESQTLKFRRRCSISFDFLRFPSIFIDFNVIRPTSAVALNLPRLPGVEAKGP